MRLYEVSYPPVVMEKTSLLLFIIIIKLRDCVLLCYIRLYEVCHPPVLIDETLRPIACNYDESSDKTKISNVFYLLQRTLIVNYFRKCYQKVRSPFTFFKIK